MNFAARRAVLLKSLKTPALLFSGGEVPRNYLANSYRFRADSNFLYYFQKPEPNSAALFDPADGTVTLYLPERTLEDALWDGPRESFEQAGARHGVDEVVALEKLEPHVLECLRRRPLHSLAVADAATAERARALTGEELRFEAPSLIGSAELKRAIATQRLLKDADEISQMRVTAEVTRQAHVSAMRHSKVGTAEQWLAGEVEGIFSKHGCVNAYEPILSVRGEVLHTRDHSNILRSGDIMLLDAGAEAASGYCSDVTRAWPVGGPFGGEGREIYELVLRAQLAAIAAVKPGARYRDIHFVAARVLVEGLEAMGLLRGELDGLIESGAHAMFFPHGVGHLIGLDVHDMESFGDEVQYGPGRLRSEQFGTQFLRLDLDLVAGMTFTIEPGLYFVPAILHSPELRARFASQVDFEFAEQFLQMNQGRGFGGIRIEDDVLCTARGPEVLTAAIPKGRVEVEALATEG